MTYRIAFACESGEWDVFFEADDNDAANAYAEEHYTGQEWYITDESGNNING